MPTTAAAKFMNQLVQIIEKQDLRISHLQSEIDKLKAWSDLNDHYLEEMVESQGSALDRLYTVIQEIHDGNVIEERLEELEKEGYIHRVYGGAVLAEEKNDILPLKLRDSQNDLIFEGFIALIEPILPGVSQTIARLRSAKMNVVLFCDEASEKNYQIARAIGMVSSRENVISGEKLRELVSPEPSPSDKNILKYTMFEGMSVADKELAIRKFRENGSTVAFLGNKLKEITLLREADIGMTECMTLTGGDEENLEYKSVLILKFQPHLEAHTYNHRANQELFPLLKASNPQTTSLVSHQNHFLEETKATYPDFQSSFL